MPGCGWRDKPKRIPTPLCFRHRAEEAVVALSNLQKLQTSLFTASRATLVNEEGVSGHMARYSRRSVQGPCQRYQALLRDSQRSLPRDDPVESTFNLALRIEHTCVQSTVARDIQWQSSDEGWKRKGGIALYRCSATSHCFRLLPPLFLLKRALSPASPAMSLKTNRARGRGCGHSSVRYWIWRPIPGSFALMEQFTRGNLLTTAFTSRLRTRLAK